MMLMGTDPRARFRPPLETRFTQPDVPLPLIRVPRIRLGQAKPAKKRARSDASPLNCSIEKSALRQVDASENHQRHIHESNEQCGCENALSSVLHFVPSSSCTREGAQASSQASQPDLGRCCWSLPTPTLWVNEHPLLTGFAQDVAFEPLPSSRSLPNTADATADVGGLPTLVPT